MEKIGIYGAGGQGRIFLEALRQDGVECDFFIDQFSSQKEVLGVPVLRLSDVRDRGGVRLYVSIAVDDRTGTDINENLRKDGFGNVIDFVSALKRHSGILKGFASRSLLWMRPDAAEMLDVAKLEKVSSLLRDEASRRCLNSLMAFRRTMSSDRYPMPDGQAEYFPGDIDLFSGIDRLRFVDCGAYRGDTVEEVMKLGRKVEYVASFEPDAANLEKLRAVTGRFVAQGTDARFFCFAAGVWSKPDVLRFDCRGSSSTTIVQGDAGGDNVVLLPVTSIDAALSGAAPNFIKMDIEGAEQEALRGCKDIIARHRPVLAVCVYHKPADLWEIPLLVHELCPDYLMYLRLHSHMGTSTVLYCVPPSGT